MLESSRSQAAANQRGPAQMASESSAITPPSEFVDPLWTEQFEEFVGIETADNEVYVSKNAGSPRLWSFDIQSGEERWSREIPAPSSPNEIAVPRVIGSSVIVRDNVSVTAYQRSSGDEEWSVSYPSASDQSTLAVAPAGEDRLLVTDEQDGLEENQLLGINMINGATEWQETVSLPGAHLGTTLPYSPSDPDVYVMFATTDGHRILDLNATAGVINNEYTIPVADPSSSLDRRSVSFRTLNDELFQIRTAIFEPSQTEVRRVFTSLDDEPEVVLSGSMIQQVSFQDLAYLVEDNESVRAVSAPSGDTLWEEPPDPAIARRRVSPSFGTEGRFYELRFISTSEGGFNGQVIARDVATGDQEWSQKVFNNIAVGASQPPFTQLQPFRNGQIFIELDDGIFTTLNATNGEVGEWGIKLDSEAGFYQLRPFPLENDTIITREATSSGQGTTVQAFPEPESGGSNEPEIADYTSDGSIVETSGLLEAIEDWRSDEIGTTLLLNVIEAWRSGDPVN